MDHLILMDEIKSRIETAQSILVASHIRPDGDAVGSLLGLGLALKNAGKNVCMVLADGVPSNLNFLPGSEYVQKKPVGDFDLFIVLDVSDINRIGFCVNNFDHPSINIDHHLTNGLFADINLIDPLAVSTTEILAVNMPHWGLEIKPHVAEDLLAGMITDTIGFRTNNMKSSTLRLAADLVEHGANLPDLYHKLLNQKSFETLRFWGYGLSRVKKCDEIVWTALSLEDRKSAGYPGRDDADLINVLSNVKEASVYIIFVEQPGGKIKISWRSTPDFDVSKIAMQYGGGGHPAAAGAEVNGKLNEICLEVIKVTKHLLFSNN